MSTCTTTDRKPPLQPLDVKEPRCGGCGRILTEVLMQPGAINRIKCHCKTWTVIYVVRG